MSEARRTTDPLVRSILMWADAQRVPTLLPDHAPGTDERERALLAALGGVAKVVSGATGHGSPSVPTDVGTWFSNAPSPPTELADDVRRALRSGRDLFGELYNAVVSTPHRRRLGTVFTPPAVTAHMLAQCDRLGIGPSVVIDPGAGVGAFTIDAANKWGVPVVAVDLNVATLGFLAARCRFLGHQTCTHLPQDDPPRAQPRGICLVQEDFLAWLPKGLYKTSTPALIIGNPPYTRHQGMKTKLKEAAREAAGPLVSSGLAGMAAYFLGASLRYLRPDDALCMVLPGSWMHARYGRELRQHLWSLTQRRVQLDVFPHEAEVFPQSKVDAVVLVVGPQEEERCQFTVAETSTEGTNVNTIGALNIDRANEQPASFPRTLTDWNRPSKHCARLGDSFTVHRGIATGRNAFFLLSDAEVEDYQIPTTALAPAIGRLKDTCADAANVIDEATFTLLGERGVKRWLLMLEPSDVSTPEIRRYLEHGARQGVDRGYLARQRRHWYVVEDTPPAPLLLVPMAKREFRVTRNTKGVRHTNNLYGLYPLSDHVNVEGAARWLRGSSGQQALRRAAHRYGGGMLKLEPRAVGQVEVPASFGRT